MAKKKGKVAIVIALKPLGGVAPKKPEDTANVGVKKEEDPDTTAHNESLCSTCKNDHDTCGDDLNCPCCNAWRGVKSTSLLFPKKAVGVKKGNVGDCPKCGMTGYLPCVTCDRYSRKAVGVEKTPRKCKNCNCSRSECVCKAGYC